MTIQFRLILAAALSLMVMLIISIVSYMTTESVRIKGETYNKIILSKDISPSLGLIHRAHSAAAKPLVYDLMEMFRADMVDFVLLKYLRLKKRGAHALLLMPSTQWTPITPSALE